MRSRGIWGRHKAKTEMQLGRIDWKISSSEATRVVASFEAEGVDVLGPYVGRRLISSEPTRVVGSVEAKGLDAARLHRPKDDKKRGHEGRSIGLSRKLTSSEATMAVESA